MDLRRHMPWLCWELLFSMLCICFTHIGSSLNLEFMISSRYVVIMIMLMSICVYMYVCMYVMSDRVIMDHDYFMLIFICTYVCMYVCCWLTRSLLFYVDVYIYVCVCCILFSDKIMLFMLMFMYMYVCINVSM